MTQAGRSRRALALTAGLLACGGPGNAKDTELSRDRDPHASVDAPRSPAPRDRSDDHHPHATADATRPDDHNPHASADATRPDERDPHATADAPDADPTHAPARPPLAVLDVRAALPTPLPADLRWLAIGGGATPEYNQVSIEQDLRLAQEVFGTGGAMLFAGGAGSHGVQVADPSPRGDPLIATLADLFSPRGGRAATYRPTTLTPLAAATPTNALAALAAALAEPGPPLLVYLAGHGERGEQPRLGGISLWGQDSLRVADLAAALDGARRPAQIVATSCFSGAFGELVFTGADPAAGPAKTTRCGLFAATAERESSGCDPNPDRAAQDGFGLHFLHALRGEDRGGAPLPAGAIDVDGDGRISPLEAHARARIAGAGIDVPTTTSDRWLRAVAPTRGRSRPPALPEEDAVIAGLGQALGLAGREADAAAALEAVLKDMDDAYARLDEASAREDAAYRVAAAELLARFPVLDDPWHPDFAATIAAHRGAIEALLTSSPALAEFRAAQAATGAAQDEVAALLARSARLERLARAVETRALAGRLHARGGPGWRTYAQLLACERDALE